MCLSLMGPRVVARARCDDVRGRVPGVGPEGDSPERGGRGWSTGRAGPPGWPIVDAVWFAWGMEILWVLIALRHARLPCSLPFLRRRRGGIRLVPAGSPGRGGPGELRLPAPGGAGHPHARPRPGPAGRPGRGAAHPGLARGRRSCWPARRGGRAALAARAGLRGRRVPGAAAAARRGQRGAGRAVAAGVAGRGAQGRGRRGGARGVPGPAGVAYVDAGHGRLPDHPGGGAGRPAARRRCWPPATRSRTSSSSSVARGLGYSAARSSSSSG